ncbi:MAG: hypothetical protein KC910_12125 [Candidatus Eremiobacteraeota bacterium]|nr:hypothetical protein [Candidatus Eremiobacteraeota bacterium]
MISIAIFPVAGGRTASVEGILDETTFVTLKDWLSALLSGPSGRVTLEISGLHASCAALKSKLEHLARRYDFDLIDDPIE